MYAFKGNSPFFVAVLQSNVISTFFIFQQICNKLQRILYKNRQIWTKKDINGVTEICPQLTDFY